MAGWGRFGLPLMAGILAALGHAPFDLWPAALLGFGLSAYLVANSPKPTVTGWLIGVGYFATSLHWIVQPFLVDLETHGWMAPFALVFLSGGLALFWGAAGWSAHRMAGNPALNWALALSLAEITRGHVLTGFPWALPAYLWTETPVRMTAALIGPYGLSLVTLCLVGFGVSKLGWPRVVVAGLGLAGLFGLSMIWQSTHPLSDPIEPKTVRLVQPNAPQNEKWDPDKRQIFVDRQLEFTAAPKDGVDLIVWPESAVPYWFSQADDVLQDMAEAADGVPLVFGINRGAGLQSYNAMVYLSAGGDVQDVYDKMRLVPFGEYIPFGGLAKLVGLRSMAARDGFGFSPGAGVRLIDTSLGKALPLICYEAIFPRHPRQAEARADYLIQITNDAWFGTFSGPFQHLQQAQFRAIEQGLPMIRAANTGISAVINPHGQVTAQLGLGETGYLDATLSNALSPTPYGQIGDLPVIVINLFTVIALFVLGRRNSIAIRETSS